MLFKSNAGKKGLRALFQAYDTNFGSTANALAKEQGYRIGRRKIPLLSGECKCDEKVIVVSRSKPAVAEEFTIFHELAHHFLDGLAPVFGEQKYLPPRHPPPAPKNLAPPRRPPRPHQDAPGRVWVAGIHVRYDPGVDIDGQVLL